VLQKPYGPKKEAGERPKKKSTDKAGIADIQKGGDAIGRTHAGIQGRNSQDKGHKTIKGRDNQKRRVQ